MNGLRFTGGPDEWVRLFFVVMKSLRDYFAFELYLLIPHYSEAGASVYAFPGWSLGTRKQNTLSKVYHIVINPARDYFLLTNIRLTKKEQQCVLKT